MNSTQEYYLKCGQNNSEKLKKLGFKKYKHFYYRVIDHTVQSFCFYAAHGYRDIRFDIIPLCHTYMSKDIDGTMWGYFFESNDIDNVLYQEPISNVCYWVDKVSDCLANHILPGFEIASTTENGYFLKRFIKENCPAKNHYDKNIFEDYMWYFQLGKYREGMELLYANLEEWKTQHDLSQEYERISYENLLVPINQWCDKSDDEIKKAILENEKKNLSLLGYRI